MNRLAFCLAIACCAFGVVAQQRVETAAEEPEGYEYVPLVREGVEWGGRGMGLRMAVRLLWHRGQIQDYNVG